MIAVLINGQRPADPGCAIGASDRGLHYGDGLFETMLLRQGGVCLLDEHWQRLSAGCARLAIPCPDRAVLRQEIQQLTSGAGEGVIKVVVTRGAGGRAYAPPANASSTRIVAWYPLPTPSRFEVAARWCDTRLGRNGQLAGIKHLNRLEQILAQMQVESAGTDEGLLLDSEGELVSAVASNVFLVRSGALLTPDLRYCGVRGVMRAQVLKLANELGIVLHEAALRLEDVQRAEELFLTNAVRGLRPLVALDGRRWPVGAVTLQLHAELLRRFGPFPILG